VPENRKGEALMTEHLPECPVWRCCKPDEKATMHMCICSDEERVGGLITRKIFEKIGRRIGQYGCVIPEQQHLPECPCEPCICSYLRACEERVEALRTEWYSEARDYTLIEAVAAIKGEQESPPPLPPSVGIPEKKGCF